MKVRFDKRLLKRFFLELQEIRKISDKPTTLAYFSSVCISLPQIIASGSLVAADQRMSGRMCRFAPCGRVIIINGRSFGLAREIYCQKCYLPALEGFQINASDQVVDLGANVGVFSLLAGQLARKVTAVEAQSKLVETLKLNVGRNNLASKIDIVLGLVGSGTGVFSDEGQLRSSSHCRIPPPKLTMPQILNATGIDSIGFLKVDIEGSEFDLLGPDSSWLKQVEKIAMEVHQEYGNIDRAVATLRDYGFQTWLRNKYGGFVNELQEDIGYLYALKA